MKHIPMRTCVTCRVCKPKSEFLRIVKQADGAIIVDLTGRADGRGAYVCKSAECVEQTAKKKSLNRAFKCNIDPEVYVKIKECLNG